MSGSKISGILFLDQNADGSEGSSDAAVSGATVSLLDSTGKVLATTTTDSTGAYSFASLAAGTYYVQFGAPTGDAFSPAGTSSTLPNSVVGTTGKTAAITIGSSDVTGQNAGVYAPVSLSGTVFTDSNDDGLVDGADKGQAGVTVQLLNAQGQATGATTTTASDGTYSFKNLAPGTYSVHVVMPTTPAGGVFSPMGSNTPPQATGGTVTTAQNLLTNGSFDNGLTATGSFSTAQGYTGWTVSKSTSSTPYGSGPGNGPEIAWTNGSNAVAVDPTGATNSYAGVVASDNVNTAPYTATGSGTHAAFFVDDGAIETLSQTVTLTAGQTYEIGFDLNETTPGQNNPGFFQLTAAIGSQTITTAGSTSGTKLTPGTWTHFADLYTPTTTGSVTLTFTYSSGTPGSTLASKDVLVDDVYIVPGQVTQNLTTTSEVNSSGNTAAVTLTSGQTVGNESAGIYLPPAAISGTVFTDLNADGALGTGDTGLSGRTVNLSSGGTVIATTTTDANGNYSFTNQAAGTYSVQVVAPSSSYKFSPTGSSTTLTDSTVGTTGYQTVTVANGGTGIVNAGLYVPVSITGTVFTDANGDGAKQSTDAGLAGTTVKLIGSDGKTVVATTATSSTGTYSFTGQVPGTYTVQIVAPTGDGVSQPGTSTTLTDSTVGSTASQIVTLTSGGTVAVNAGLYAPGTVSGTVFGDSNADGAQQSGDAGLGGQIVKLIGPDGSTVLATTTTASNGTYSFTGVTPGSDTIQVVAPTGAKFSPVGNSTTLTDSTVSATGAAPITITSGSTSTVNAGVYAPASVSGTVFIDANADGAQQAGDTAVSGQTVKLLGSDGKTIVATTTTAANGSYSFTGLTPGSFTVQTTAPAGDTFSPVGTSTTLPDSSIGASGSAAITLMSGQNATLNAGEYAPSTISGTIFGDTNADGAQQSGDAGLGGQTVQLIGPDGATVLATTTTASNGTYSFTGVTPGSDTIQVVAPAGAKFSPVGSSPTLTDSNVSATGAKAVVVTSGSASTVNAGVYAPVSISGTVFIDANADGAKQSGEAALGGQTVNLLAADGKTVVASTSTASNGAYSFTGQVPGTYTVQVVVPTGDGVSPKGSSTTLTDSTVGTTGSQTVTLASGGSATVNAGLFVPGTITGTIFGDSNADGAQQSGDAGLGGQTVQLIGPDGATVLATTTTASNGTYSFTGVTPGSDTIQFVAPAGAKFSPVGSSPTLTDSTVSATGAAPITITSGSTSTVNAGVYAPASVSGTVFIDANADGAQQAGDTAVSGQTVKLLGSDGKTIVATTTTAANGSYSFTGLTPGSFTVQTTAPAGDTFSPVGTSTTLPDSSIGASGSAAITLMSGQNATLNAGEYAPGTISGTIFGDTNADGAQQSGDAGLGGQTVQLIGPDGATVLATTTTASNGTYSFTGVTPGNDTIQVVAPAGAKFSPVGSSPTLTDSNVSATGAKAVVVTSGSASTVNAGVYAPVSISGTVFIDANADGAKQSGEAALGGQTVNLLAADGKTVVASTSTSSNGAYSFTGQVPGTYTVQVVVPTGDGVSPKGSSTTLTDSTVGTTGSQTVTLASGGSATVNAGLFVPGTITGTIFGDSNADGAQQSGDAGLGGQTVQLIGPDGATVLATTTTASNGTYSFTGVTPGSDTIQFVAPAGAKFSPVGSSPTLTDSTVSATGAAPITITSGSASTVNAGLYAPGTVSGTVFGDSNADGAQQSGDAGLGGQIVKLIGPDGSTVLATTTTASNGSYSFTGVTPGNDTIQVVAPTGAKFSPAGSSTTLTDSNVSATGAAPITITSGSTATVNAGVYAPASVSGTVFIDANADGAQQAGDTAASGQTVKLLGSDGKTIVATTTTAANGSYSFTGLTPGSFTVQTTAPAGDTFSPVGTSTTLPDSSIGASGSAAITLMSGQNATLNAGEYAPGTISGTIFGDTNADGAQQSGDAGLGGQTVQLIGPDGATVLATTTTASNGTYSFTGVTPGNDTIQVVAPAGAKFSPVGSSPTLTDSNVSATGAKAVVVTSGSASTVNAGLYAPGTVSGTVFGDANADGAQQSGDAGLGGQIVKLIGPDGSTVLATTTTASNGGYSFTGVTPGSDTIQVVAPAGAKFSPVGSSTTLTDSNVSAAGTKAVAVTSGSTATVNAGVYALGTINGTVFGDSNADGAQQNGDAGLGGQTVQLVGPDGTTVLATTTTASNGTYSFTGVTPGNDTIQVVAPAGAKFSPVGSSTTLTDSNVSATGAKAVAVSSGGASTVNAGVYAPASVSGTLFNDVNGDGARQSGDAGLGGQTVMLIAADGTTVVATTATGADGSYNFSGLTPGSYAVQTSVPAGDTFSPAGTSTTLPDSNVGISGSAAITLASGQSAVVNAGAYAPGTIAGTIFGDTNADGVQQGVDAGLGGQTVQLIGPDGSTVLATTTTASNGSYSFTGAVPGNDTIQVVAPAGARFSPVGGSTTLLDSTVSAAGSAPITVTSGSTSTVNAGLYVPGTVSGTIFGDANADGVQQNGDAGLGGQIVKLIGPDGSTVLATTTTASNGGYSFTGVTPGSDTIQVVAPAGALFSPTGSSPTLPDSNVSATGAKAVVLTSGSTSTVNAGVYALSTITGTVFGDSNADGVKQNGDAGLGGQTVQLLASDGTTVLATATTAANGSYSFAGEAPGTYTVQVIAPSGTSFSPAGTSPSLLDSNVSSTGAATVTTLSGSTGTVNAGIYGPPVVTGTVFNDLNADGTLESGDAGLGGQTVNLIGADGVTVVATTMTNPDGSYSLTGTRPGAYTVQVVKAPGESFSPAGTSATLPNSSVGGNGSVAVTLHSGTNVVNAGEYATATLGGTVFLDANADGLDDLGNPVLKGVVANLLNGSGQIVATTTTDATGHYQFTGATPGTYQVQFIVPAGTNFTPYDHVGSDPSINSHAYANGITETVTLAGLQDDENLGAGLSFNSGLHNGATTVVVPAGTAFPGETQGGSTVIAPGANTNIHGGQGNNFIITSGANDIVESGQAIDFIQLAGGGLGQANANVQGLGLLDYIFGGAGGDTLQGGSGSDYMVAGNSSSFLAGGSGHNTLIAGPDNGTISYDGTTLSNVKYGDQIFTGPGVSSVLYQKGDGVTELPDFNPGKGDTLTIYGYSGFQAVGQVNGQTILYLGPNAGFVLPGSYDQSLINDAAHLPGITFVPTGRPTPQLVLEVNTLGQPTLIDSGKTVILAPAPTLTEGTGSGTTGATTSDTAVSGTTSPGLVVTVSNGSTVLGTATADAAGNYVFRDPALADGTYQLTTSVTDVTGQSASATATLVLDATTPVQQAYMNVLGRAADAGGLAGFRTFLESGGTTAQVLGALAGSGEAQNDISGLYQAVLGRVADQGGLSGFQSLLANGGSLGDVRTSLAYSGEAQNDISALYQTLLGRAADAGGLANFESYLAHGASLSDVGTALANSAEGQAYASANAGAVSSAFAPVTQQTVGSTSGMTIITGTSGNDTLAATSAADLFVLGGSPSGADTITGFDVLHDMLQISHLQAATFAAIQADTTATAGGALITLDSGSSVLLAGISPNQLQSSNFHIV